MSAKEPRNAATLPLSGPFTSSPVSERYRFLNDCYAGLIQRRKPIERVLREHGLRYKTGFYNQHAVRISDEWGTELFPIPVIEVLSICDIGVDLDHTFIEGYLDRNQAIQFDYHVFDPRSFSVYGCEAFLEDYYRQGMDIEGIGRLIETSQEKRIGISVELPSAVDPKEVVAVIQLYQRLGIRYTKDEAASLEK